MAEVRVCFAKWYFTATSVDVGKVIDIEIFIKFCACKQKLENIHEDIFKANYFGTSGGM